jgi:hypothetical protein
MKKLLLGADNKCKDCGCAEQSEICMCLCHNDAANYGCMIHLKGKPRCGEKAAWRKDDIVVCDGHYKALIKMVPKAKEYYEKIEV